ncbi:MAG: 4-hydroxybenzoate octaprenyltransferase [Acidocella sp.]|nr:4-hydroxybenzoate octaprenyltransferase [Acidocella sp.]
MSQHTDIVVTGWVARLPARWRPYVLLARLDRPIGIWLLLLPGVWSIGMTARGMRLPWLLALFGLGAVVMRGAGCLINDMWDRELDRKVARTAGRPLAAGLVSLRQALAFLTLLLAVGLLILLRLNRVAIWLGVLSLLPVALYPLAKRVTWWPQAMLGLTFSWGAPMGYAAGAGRLAPAAWALYAAAFFWILGYDTIYAHQDREDDALAGIRSTARRFAHASQRFVGICYAAMLGCLLLAGWQAELSGAFLLFLSAAAALLARQVVLLDINDPARCLSLFKSNREVGLLVGLAVLAGRL